MTHVASNIWVNVGSGNGWSSVRRQSITLTNADFLCTGPFWAKLNEIVIKMQKFFCEDNAFENIVCAMSAIVIRPRFDKKRWNTVNEVDVIIALLWRFQLNHTIL